MQDHGRKQAPCLNAAQLSHRGQRSASRARSFAPKRRRKIGAKKSGGRSLCGYLSCFKNAVFPISYFEKLRCEHFWAIEVGKLKTFF